MSGKFDYIVVGSGAGGAAVALGLAKKGASVLVLESGPSLSRRDFRASSFSALARLCVGFGQEMAHGRSFIPTLRGRGVGGTTLISGAILHRLPESAWQEWAADSGLARSLSYSEIESASANLEQSLRARRNLESLLPSLPISRALRALGFRHQAMLRAAPECESSGRCLQGCPTGAKLTADSTLLKEAAHLGAEIRSECDVLRVRMRGNLAIGITYRAPNGETIDEACDRGVVVAAGTLASPDILYRSGIARANGVLGENFQCHLSASITARLPIARAAVEGPPQGVEVTEFLGRDVKLASQMQPPELLALRIPAFGANLAQVLRHIDHYTSWMTNIRARALGSLRFSRFHTPRLYFTPNRNDLEATRFGLTRIGEILFAAGAEEVYPGIAGVSPHLRRSAELTKIEAAALDPRQYLLGAGHLFGTCRMGSDSRRSVVDPDFRVHGTRGLYVADASIFPGAIGVNPQLAIMSLATLAADRITSERVSATTKSRVEPSERAPERREESLQPTQ